MRRQSKKSKGVVKVLTAAALVTALSAGTLTAYAGTNDAILGVDMGNGTIQRFTVEQLETNEYYRNLILSALNGTATDVDIAISEAGYETEAAYETLNVATPMNIFLPYEE